MKKNMIKIHPSVGVARVGNSTGQFYLAPETIGGLPIECDEFGNEKLVRGKPKFVQEFKDQEGAIKRQGAKFKLFRYDKDPNGTELTLDDADVKSIEWNVHIANKKAGFWNFAELIGNTMISPDNTYEAWAKKGKVTQRNASVQGKDRQKLIIDPGPRNLKGAKKKTNFSKATIPKSYKFGSFPPKPTNGYEIKTLGDMMTDNKGRLTVVAAYGNAGGNEPITSYAGADTWHDDTADGQVVCTVTMKTGESFTMDAWVICASTKFAPELVNISTLSDTMLDVAIRYKNYVPTMYNEKKWKDGWNPDYIANFERDILPIISRPRDYIWVANVPSMVAFTSPFFDVRDNSDDNAQNRKEYFGYWRDPNNAVTANGYNQLWDKSMMPMMPINSGTNSVTNEFVQKFLTLNPTQYFLLGQWAKGKFTDEAPKPYPKLHPLDEASVGNCVGLPMSPGIEVTWSVNNPALYKEAYRIKLAHNEAYYNRKGLSPLRNETEGGGCEPGDLSKRMAIPWQADFFQCTVQYVNFTDPKVNKADGVPVPPTYYSYWWPPQSPWDVITGSTNADEQAVQGVPAGVQVNYARGINSFSQMITSWKFLGFVLNQNEGPNNRNYPYFVEKERNNNKFEVAAVAVGGASVLTTGDDSTFVPMWYLKDDAPGGGGKSSAYKKEVRKLKAKADSTEEEVEVRATLGLPRTGSRVRF